MDEILKAMAINASQASSAASQFMLTSRSNNSGTLRLKNYNAASGKALAKQNGSSVSERDASSRLGYTDRVVARTSGGSFYY